MADSKKYNTEELSGMGYSPRLAGQISGIVEHLRGQGYEPYIGPGAVARDQSMAAKNVASGAGSKNTKHYVTARADDEATEDTVNRYEALGINQSPAVEWENSARAVDMKLKRPGWKRGDGTERYLSEREAGKALKEASASQGWAQPAKDPYMLSRKFPAGDWAHIEPLETMRERYYAQSKRSLPVDSVTTRAAVSAVDSAYRQMATSAVEEAVAADPPSAAADESNYPMPQEVLGRLRSIADAGYQDDVQEYLTTSRIK